MAVGYNNRNETETVVIRSTKASIKHNYKKQGQRVGGSSGSETNMVITNMSDIVQSQQISPFSIAAIGVLGAVLGALAGGYATYSIEKLKIKNNEYEKRRQLYARLGGLVVNLSQIIMGFQEFRIYQLFHKSKWIRLGEPVNSIELKSSDNFYELRVDTAFKLRETQVDLYETLSTIRLLFNRSDKLETLIRRFDFINNVLDDKYDIDALQKMDDSQLDNWCRNEVGGLSYMISREIMQPFTELQSYLKSEIDLETKNLYERPFWKLW